VLGWTFALDLPFCMLIQTVTLVAFNKVGTTAPALLQVAFGPYIFFGLGMDGCVIIFIEVKLQPC
jgi:hypothetical protein